MKKTLLHFAVSILIMTTLVSGCFPTPPHPIPTPTPAPTHDPSADLVQQYLKQQPDLAPKVIEISPAPGEAASLGGDLTLSFDQPMDPNTTAKALAVTDSSQKPVEGDISWKDSRILVFHPRTALKAGVSYQARLDTTATSVRGKALTQPVALTFQTVGDLIVSQVFPADKAINIENSAAITVMFNRPVVPLVIAEEQASLVNPLQIDPAIQGHGEWVNTSLYVFRPAGLLVGGQTYHVKIKAGLTDASGEAATKLKEDYVWSFSVASPAISSVTINGIDLSQLGSQAVPLNPTLSIGFRQPMDGKSVIDAMTISAGGRPVAVNFQWDENHTLLDVKPALYLQLNTTYDLQLDASARAVDGGSLANGMKASFTTVPYPAVLSTTPSNGTANADPSFQINFAGPMDFKSLATKVVFAPALDVTNHSWYDPTANVLYIYGLEPSTKYLARLLPGMRDPYGNAIQRETAVIFTTRPLIPMAMLMMPYQPVYRAGGPQDFYLQTVNVDSVNAQLYPLNINQFAKMAATANKGGNLSVDGLVSTWQYTDKPAARTNAQVVKNVALTGQDGKALTPGFYFLGMQASPVDYKGPFLDSRLFFVNTENITVKVSPGQLLAWVTDLATGKPASGRMVSVYAPTPDFTLVASGVTNADGLYQAQINTSVDASSSSPYKDNYQSWWYVLVDEPGHFAFASSQWGSGVSPASNGPNEQYYRPWMDATAYVYTERPLYRPGQPVYFKGIVRSDDDLVYSLPAQRQVEVIISDYKGQVFSQTYPLSDIGAFDGTFPLASETSLGSYTLQVRWPGEVNNDLGSATFDVAEYRRPEFQMDVQASPVNILPWDVISVAISASYYSGGGLSDAGVDWTLRSEPFTFTPPSDYGSYSFSDNEYDNWNYYNRQPAGGSNGQIAAGQTTTDANGKATVSLIAQPAVTPDSQRLIFEATITDFSGSSVSGQSQVVMHKSAIYPGIRSKSYVGMTNEDQTFELVALDWDGKPLNGARVDVSVVERHWYSVQQEDDNGQLYWNTTVEEIPAAAFSGVQLDSKGLGTVTFRPQKAGIYRAKVTALDSHGNPAMASAFIWIAGEDYVPWFQTNDRSFQLVADKDTYSPGDNAELLIASPFQGESYALVTVERGHVRKAEVVKLESNSTIYKLPVTPDMAPDVYVSVLVVKGIDAANPRPNFKVGIARLKVNTGEQTLKVTLQTDKSQAAPRQQVQYTVTTTTLSGQPVQADVSLALSDLATLSLKDSTVPSLLDFFYSPRGLSVTTGVGIVQSIEDYNAQVNARQEATGKGMGSGGGKGSGYTGVMEIRQDFPDTAFWQASVRTGADGTAAVTVTLPDNLTTWRMDARAVTADTRVGQATLDLMSTKPLLIRPQTPRFFVEGDHLQLGAAIHNNTTQDLNVAVKLDATGITLDGPAGQTVAIPANQQSYVTWTASVPVGSQRVDLVFSASTGGADGGGFSDATRPTLGTLDNQGLPVYRYETPETVGTSGLLSDNGGRAESISLPASMQVQKGELKVELAPSLAAGLTDGLTYLETFPYECTEQTISSFLPNIRLAQALKAAGIQDTLFDEALKTQVNLALQKLYSRQNPDGGWGWWNGMMSDVQTSAYATLGLIEAHAAGYTVNALTVEDAVAFLASHLAFINNLAAAQDLNRQAFVLYVLARASSPQVSPAVQLYDQRQSMSLYARAYLLQTLFLINPQDERLKTLTSDLNSAAILSAAGAHWEEKSPDPWNWNTDIRSTAIILAALIETDPQNALNANAVRWLMTNRKDGRWNGTQETAWTLMALTDWVTATGDLNPDYHYGVAFNGNVLAEGVASKQTNRDVKQLSMDVTQMLSDQANILMFARDGSAGNLYYTAYLNVWLPVNQVKALDRGVVVSRQYFRPDDLVHPVSDAKQGEVLLARLTVVAPDTLRYLLVDDPLPAGMEAVDTSLNTSPQAQQPDTYDWKRVDTDGWGWWFFSHIELRDERVILSTDTLPAGTYVYTYLVRASTPGTFNVMPPTAQEFYFPDVYGRGDGSQFIINPAQ